MKIPKSLIILALPLILTACWEKKPADISEMFEMRKKSIVVIQYTLTYEIDREKRLVYATVIDDEGLLVTHSATPDWLPISQVKDIKVYPLGEHSKGYDAEFFGKSEVTGLYYFRVEEAMWDQLVPVTKYSTSSVELGEELWGVCALGLSDTYFKPYYTKGSLTLEEYMPWHYGIASNVVSCIGGPVFNRKGEFVGQTVSALNVSYDININNKKYVASMKRKNASEIVLLADDFMPHVLRNPEEQLNVDHPWLGLVGIEALPKPTLEILGLKDQGALVISKVIEGSPADKVGIAARDIIIKVEGEALKQFPDPNYTAEYFSIIMSKHKPGDEINLSILRGDAIHDLTVVIGKAPKRDNKAERQYFPKLGFTSKEFTYTDALLNHLYSLDFKGVIAHFVRPNSPVEDAGLKEDDWILEIDGEPVESYEEAETLLAQLESSKTSTGFVLLIERRNETKLLRVKLN